ncbi:MAG: hypothetical protein K2W96_20010 [Gemmataceae bacterium]|nr:hypothetical protein [Gemmataceae bacterium]
MRFWLLALALLFCSTLAAQDKDKNPDKKDDKKEEKKDDKKDKEPKAGPFEFPLKVGTKWTYRVGENRYVQKIAKMEAVGKTQAARLEMTINDKQASFEHVAIGSDKDGVRSVMRYSFEGKQADPPIPFLQLAADKTSWRVDSKLEGGTLKGLFRKTLEDVTVPAGKYPKAVRVASDGLKVNGVDLTVTWWFASGVGLVKMEATIAGQTVTSELEKYEPGM